MLSRAAPTRQSPVAYREGVGRSGPPSRRERAVGPWAPKLPRTTLASMSGQESVTVQHLDGDRLEVRIRDHVLVLDQPQAAGGADTGPTPTELLIASLAGCVAFYAERFLQRHGGGPRSVTVECGYRWAENPHRVGSIEVRISAPGLAPELREALSRVVEHCPVHNTLAGSPQVRFSFDEAVRAVA